VYTPGKLLYFDPFYFKNGNPDRRKYFLVLKIIDENVIIACLPSSKNHLPASQPIVHGCLEITDACISCYIFEANRPITKDGWFFNLDTILYGGWLDDFNINDMNSKYSIAGVDYEIIGELTDQELENVIKCFSNSSVVKNRYKRALSGHA
jgi:hypothetical protein